MKSLHKLHNSVLLNVGHHCSVDTALDLLLIETRCKDEGDGFLTITLPKFAKALERGLEDGFWPRHMASSFTHHGGLPAFMRGFLTRIFDRTGRILDDPDPDSIWAVRQVCYLTHKVERDCTPERESAALRAFVETDASLVGLPGRIDTDRLRRFRATSRRLFGTIFAECDRKIAHYELIPKHGPGAVAEGLSQKEKRSYTYWTERMESVFPRWRYTANTPSSIGDPGVPITDELPVRVVSVPKTQSTPRIIAIEPSSVQYAQQGLKRELYEMIGRGPLGRVLGFQDQERNRSLALHASLTGSHATLDLSEASDRVHWFLVREMTRDWPHLWDFIWSTRSHRAEVPGEGIIPLQKFASMGSALTFPIEAMVFTILSVCGLEQATGRRWHRGSLPGAISVYGDDIVVPTDATACVIDWLEHFGAKVNRHKSFWNGKFRESCGAEYYNGHDVSVVRLRSELPRSRKDAAEIASLLDFRNRAYLAGLWKTSADVDAELESLLDIPVVSESRKDRDGFLHRVTFLPSSLRSQRFNSDYQREERRVPVLRPHSVSYRVDGEAGLLEWFHDALRRDDLVDRYDSQERATSFSIQRRWVPVT